MINFAHISGDGRHRFPNNPNYLTFHHMVLQESFQVVFIPIFDLRILAYPIVQNEQSYTANSVRVRSLQISPFIDPRDDIKLKEE